MKGEVDMPNPIIEGYRNKIVNSDYIPKEVKKRMSTNKLVRGLNKQNNTNYTKEELSMSNNIFNQGVPTIPGGLPGARVPAGAGNAVLPPKVNTGGQVGVGTNIVKTNEKIVLSKIKRGFSFRPKAIITDGEEVERLVFDENNTELSRFIDQWKKENTKKDANGRLVVPKINTLRAVKELCMANPGRSPEDFAMLSQKTNVPITKTKKPSVKGYVITFPATEGGVESTSIVKKADLFAAINNQGGFSACGTYEESSLDKDKLEIPVMITLTPVERKSRKAGSTEVTSQLRTSVSLSPQRKNELFPDTNNVGVYNIFDSFPWGGYKFKRVVPLKKYVTKVVKGKKVAVIDMSAESKLTQYQFVPNELKEGDPGKEIMDALGIDYSKLQGAFEAGTKTTALETEEDVLNFLGEVYLGADAKPGVQKYLNSILHNNNNPII